MLEKELVQGVGEYEQKICYKQLQKHFKKSGKNHLDQNQMM